MQAHDFIRKWHAGSAAHGFDQRASAQAPFIDRCRGLALTERAARPGPAP